MNEFHDIALWFLAALLGIYNSGEYQSLTLPKLVWSAATVIFGISIWKMGLAATVRYFVKQWIWLLTAAVAGIAIPLMFVAPWQPRTFHLPSVLFSVPAVTSLALILGLGIVATSHRFADYWRRYLRTLCIADPPAQATFLLSAAVSLSAVIFHFFSSPYSLSFPEENWSILALEIEFWIVAPLLMAVLVPKLKVLPVFAGQKERESSGDYSDEPITTESEDLLGRDHFVRRLAAEIASLPGSNSFVFALIARWGEGKTSVLNLVKRILESHPRIIIVDFNPWYFASELGILEAFYGSIERAIESRFLLPSFKRRLRRYLKTLSVGLEHKPFSLDLELPESPERLRQELEGFIARTGTRLVIFMDDVDRVDGDLALSTLALTRLSARFQNTVFLMAFDAEELKQRGIEHKFLEKIIQQQIVLPPAEHRDLDEFFLYSDPKRASAIDSLLDNLTVSNGRKSQFHSEIDPFYPERLRSVFVTLRDVKRFLSVLRVSIAPVVDEVNLFDFFLLTALQVFTPQIYTDIWENREFYVPRELGFAGVRFSLFEGDNEARKIQVRNHIEGMLKGNAVPKDLKEILATLFPDVASAFDSMLGGSRQHPKSHEQRLSDPICFPRYFLGRLPAGQISDGEVRSVIRRWNGAGEGVGSLVAEDLQRYQQRKQIQELMERLSVFARELDTSLAEQTAQGIAQFTEKTRWEGKQDDLDDLPSASTLFEFTIAIANRVPADLFVIAKGLVQLGSIYFATGLVSWLHGRIEGMAEHGAALRALRDTAEARLHSNFVEVAHDIFIECPKSFKEILYVWATAWNTRPSSDTVEVYVIKTVEKCPSELGRLLAAFVTETIGMPDWFVRIGAVIRPDRLTELLDRFGDRAVPSGAGKLAAEEIRKAVAAATSTPQKTSQS